MGAARSIRVLSATLAALAVCAPASAQEPGTIRYLDSVPPGTKPFGYAYALAGDQAVIANAAGRVVALRVLALDVPSPAVEVFRLASPDPEAGILSLDASATTAAMVFGYEDGQKRSVIRVIAGRPAGPYADVAGVVDPARDAVFPLLVHADVDRLVLDEGNPGTQVRRTSVREPDGTTVVVGLPAEARRVDVAGDLVAYTLAGDPERIVVQEWRTGAGRREIRFPVGVETLELLADGRVLVGEYRAGVVEIGPDNRIRRLARRGESPAYAGDSVVFTRTGPGYGEERLMIAGPDRRAREFGFPSGAFGEFDADEQSVLWRSGDCVYVAPLAAPAAVAAPPGPCGRSEATLVGAFAARRVGRDGRVAIKIRCIAAPPPGCRGTVRLYTAETAPSVGSAPVRLDAGVTRAIGVRISPRAIRQLRRIGSSPGIFVHTSATDPEGRETARRTRQLLRLPARRR